jgi:hypothetical protein
VSGTVNIARSIFDHELFADQPLTEREAWIWLIMEASWKPRKKRVGDYIVDLARGELAASVRFMAGAWKWAPAKVQRFMKRLQVLDMISVKTDTGVSVITVCNYDEYQAPNKAADTDAIQVRYRSDTNEKKDEIKDNKVLGASAPEKKPSRGSRLPTEWRLPKAWGEWAVAEGMAEPAVRRQAERFRDYWVGKAGKDATKLDWEATWRNWVRKHLDESRTGARPSDDQFGAFGKIRSVG